MRWRFAEPRDCRLLAELNHQLIADEGHRNPMSVDELERRMQGFLTSEYRATLFEKDEHVVAYALFRETQFGELYLRQFFVVRDRRRQGIGREALRILRKEVFAKAARVTLEVLTRNAAGRAFWIANGFREYAVTLEDVPDAAQHASGKQ